MIPPLQHDGGRVREPLSPLFVRPPHPTTPLKNCRVDGSHKSTAVKHESVPPLLSEPVEEIVAKPQGWMRKSRAENCRWDDEIMHPRLGGKRRDPCLVKDFLNESLPSRRGDANQSKRLAFCPELSMTGERGREPFPSHLFIRTDRVSAGIV